MSEYIIEIHPKNATVDPLAAHVRAELMGAGETASNADVRTQRLYRIQADMKGAEVLNIAARLLVDPVVETYTANISKTKAKKTGGYVVDVWPKPGVTDPVGETVEKGFRDLGAADGVKATSAVRYVFPKIKNEATVKDIAVRLLANELIHDIHIRKAH